MPGCCVRTRLRRKRTRPADRRARRRDAEAAVHPVRRRRRDAPTATSADGPWRQAAPARPRWPDVLWPESPDVRAASIGRCTTRGVGDVGKGGVGVVGRCSSMRRRSVGGTTRPGVGGFGAGARRAPPAVARPRVARPRAALRSPAPGGSVSGVGGGSTFATFSTSIGGAGACGDDDRRLGRSRRRQRRRRCDRDGWFGRGGGASGSGAGGSGARRRRQLDRLHKARRRQRRRGRLRRFRCLLRRSAFLAALDDRGLGEDVARRQLDVPLPRQAIDELSRHDLFDRARRALHLDAVVALQQRRHFLARRAEQFRDLVDPNSCQP